MNYKLSVHVYQDLTGQWVVDARIGGNAEKREYKEITEAIVEASHILAREKTRWNC